MKVTAPTTEWELKKRYSEFASLRELLKAKKCEGTVPMKGLTFPPKQLQLKIKRKSAPADSQVRMLLYGCDCLSSRPKFETQVLAPAPAFALALALASTHLQRIFNASSPR
jgi:hypothetical protein